MRLKPSRIVFSRLGRESFSLLNRSLESILRRFKGVINIDAIKYVRLSQDELKKLNDQAMSDIVNFWIQELNLRVDSDTKNRIIKWCWNHWNDCTKVFFVRKTVLTFTKPKIDLDDFVSGDEGDD